MVTSIRTAKNTIVTIFHSIKTVGGYLFAHGPFFKAAEQDMDLSYT
jgi:hypothetical protein